MKGIQKCCENFMEDAKSSLELIANTCKLDEEDSTFWFNEVKFSKDSSVSQKVLESTMNSLVECGVIKEKVEFEKLIQKNLTKLKE
jgi:DNA-binding HxlR family transcriptional regulator